MIPEIGNVIVETNQIPVVGIGDVNVNDVQNVNVQPIGVGGVRTIRVADSRIWVVNPPNATQLELL